MRKTKHAYNKACSHMAAKAQLVQSQYCRHVAHAHIAISNNKLACSRFFVPMSRPEIYKNQL
jgi:hypothetical protein